MSWSVYQYLLLKVPVNIGVELQKIKYTAVKTNMNFQVNQQVIFIFLFDKDHKLVFLNNNVFWIYRRNQLKTINIKRNFFTVKFGKCPPVRPVCPPTRSGFRPPTQCSHDGKCPGSEKCCFDRCLGHHTCKYPEFWLINWYQWFTVDNLYDCYVLVNILWL